ncbi:hypothetical protein D3C72_1464090 [compost metagenome]
MLWACLQKLWPDLIRKPRRYQFFLSHDVDHPFSHDGSPKTVVKALLRAVIKDAIQAKDLELASRRIQSLFSRERDINNTFHFLMRTSERHGVKSAFYFIAGRTAGPIDGYYSLSDPWIHRLMREIHARGHEIGLHPSYNTYQNPEALQREFQTLRSVCEQLEIPLERWGGRQHYLRWSAPLTWKLWDDAGLAYDSTGSYADHTGFRMGTCYDFPVFDLRARTQLRLIERPLIAMDVTLLGPMNVRGEAAFAEIKRLKERCGRFEGIFSLLWHNSSLASKQDKQFYERVIASCAP